MEVLFDASESGCHVGVSLVVVLVLRGVLPAGFAVAMGALVSAVQQGDSLGRPLALVGIVFVLLQVLTPIHKRWAPTSATAPRRGSTTD